MSTLRVVDGVDVGWHVCVPPPTGPALTATPSHGQVGTKPVTSPRAKPLNSPAAPNGLRTGGKQVQRLQEGGQAGEGEKQ